MPSKPQRKKQKETDLTSDSVLSPPKSNDNDGDLTLKNQETTLPAGLFLRERRIEKSFQKEDVAHILRVSYIYINAIEEGLTHQLPERVYTLGYVRSYARLLGLDPVKISNRFAAEFFPPHSAGDAGKAQPAPFPDLDGEPTPYGRRVLGWTAFVMMLLMAVWTVYHHQGQGSTTVSLKNMALVDEQGKKIDQSPSILDHVAAFLSLNAAPSTKKGERKIPLPSAIDESRVKKNTKKKPGRLPGLAYQDKNSAIQKEALKAPSLNEDDISIAPQTSAAKTFVGDQSRPSITLQVRALCWVEIKDKDQKVLLSGNLKPGEKYDVPKRPGLFLSVGNAGGLWISVGGKTPVPLGDSGEVRHNIPLDDQT